MDVTGSKIYLGFDEGQSGTRAILLDENGIVQGVASGAPGNIARHSFQEVITRWSQVVDRALADAQLNRVDLAAAGFGLSSLVWQSERPVFENLVSHLGLVCPTVIFDDCLMVLRASLPQGVGIALLAGSGNGTIGRSHQGLIFRTFNNSRLGDGGGGWTLAERMIEWIACSYLGVRPETSLKDILLKAFSFGDVPSLVEDFLRRPIEYQRPSVMQMIFRAYEEQDQAAEYLLHDLVRWYIETVIAVARKLGFFEQPFDLALSGGLFTAPNSPLMGLLRHLLDEKLPAARVTLFQGWPACGAAIAAMDCNQFQVAESIRLAAVESSAKIPVVALP
jgi:N-acetylglucosamine kinase-like BadF-type ATPase